MNYFITIIAAIFVIGLVTFFKPDSNKNEVAQPQELSTTSQLSEAPPLDTSLHQANSDGAISSEGNAQDPSEKEELFDTASDFSIQPIDPASDPGNQLPEEDLSTP